MSPHRRADLAYLAAILLGVLVVVLLGPLERRLEILHINDFSGFWAGPRAVLAGVSPWDPAHYPQARIAFDTQRDDASVLNYMPWTVIALLPLGLLPLDAAAWLWMALSMICAAVALRALLREFMPGRAVVHGHLHLAHIAFGQLPSLRVRLTEKVEVPLRGGSRQPALGQPLLEEGQQA